MDESFLRGSSRGGIGGIFRNSGGRVLAQFGKEVTVDLVVHAEVLALREDLLAVVASWWTSSHSFVFESDSQSVLAWIVVSSKALWRFRNILRECCFVFGSCISLSLIHIGRTRNDVANVLVRLRSFM